MYALYTPFTYACTQFSFKIGFRDSILLHNRQTSCALTFAVQMNLQRSLNEVALGSAETIY